MTKPLVTKPFERPDFSDGQVTKQFERPYVSNERMARAVRTADKRLVNGRMLVYVFLWKVTAPNIHSSLLTFSLSIRRFWAGKRGKMEAKKGESSPSPLPHLKSPLPYTLRKALYSG